MRDSGVVSFYALTMDRLPLPDLDAKVRFLASPAAHAGASGRVEVVETHMSWVFLAADGVLKLKKPVRYPFLDFSTLEAREFYCREEARLNARLAPGVYLGLRALQWSEGSFALLPPERLPAPGCTVDWVVLMRRLPAGRMLHVCIAERRVGPREVDALVALLGRFYRDVATVPLAADDYIGRLSHEQATSREVLLRPGFDLGPGTVALLDRADAALRRGAALLAERCRQGRIVDGHGDLRPEHVCLLDPPVVIDCLEFNAQLRQVDPFDELAFLALECDIAGATWIGPRLFEGCADALGDRPAAGLVALYTALRALLRARLAMAHLLDPEPRTPAKWPPLAQRYLERVRRALDDFDRDAPTSAQEGAGAVAVRE